MIYLAALALLAIIALLYQQDRHRQETDQIIKAAELAGKAARDQVADVMARAFDREKDLLNRIQAPEAAPFMSQNGKLEKQYVSAEDDEAGWNAMGEDG